MNVLADIQFQFHYWFDSGQNPLKTKNILKQKILQFFFLKKTLDYYFFFANLI